MFDNPMNGGCLCGAVRYHIEGTPIDGFHCHCSMCRRSAGAGHLSWSMVPTRRFHIDAGEVKIYESSNQVHRGFCALCGTQMLSKYLSDADHVYITMGTLDDPGAVKPTSHIFADTTLAWDEQDDGLPRYSGMPPE